MPVTNGNLTSNQSSSWHGLAEDEEACMAAEGVDCGKTFPPKEEFATSKKGDHYSDLAKEGWKHMKELDGLLKLYPECGHQI
jgi:hypothetical protein